MLEIALLSFISAWLITLFLIRRYFAAVATASRDGDVRIGEPQRFHVGVTPRVGGLAVMVGFCLGLLLADSGNWAPTGWFLSLFLTLLPAWLVGVWEDFRPHLNSWLRLAVTLIAAMLAVILLDVRLTRLDIPIIDGWLVSSPWLAVALTLLALTGLPHAMNIIDGFNGLAGMVALLILSSMAYIAFKQGDSALLAVCVTLGAATVGFFLWNFPRGLIFAGDGGAYLWGGAICIVAVLLVQRNPQVSPWFPMMLCIYPVWETLFSIYRKSVLRHTSPMRPDGLHFHMLVYKRLVRWMIGSRDVRHIVNRNSLTAPYLWGIVLMSVIPAVIFWNNSSVLAGGCGLFVLFYLWVYRRMVRFRVPKMFILHRRRQQDDSPKRP